MDVRLVRLIAPGVICGCSIFGCTGPTFTNLGNGVGVPTESIDSYAKANGISRDDAKKRMLDESNQKRKANGVK